MSLCLTVRFKNERHIMYEFINHYLEEGVDRFILIDDNSDDNYLELNKESETIKLEKNSEGILIGKEWHIMKNFSDDCILLVLANSYYDEKDYIRNYEEFLKYSNEK